MDLRFSNPFFHDSQEFIFLIFSAGKDHDNLRTWRKKQLDIKVVINRLNGD